VISAQHRKGPQNRNSCFIILRYSLEDGNAVTRKAEVPDDVFSRAAEVHEMRIRYDPDDPAEFVFVDFPYSVVERYVVSAVLLVVGLLVAYFAFRARPATP
jgi:hypothetical protein